MTHDEIAVRMRNVVDRVVVMGTSGFIDSPLDLVIHNDIMLLDHIDRPDDIIIKDKNYYVKLRLIKDKDEIPNPRTFPSRCAYFTQQMYSSEVAATIKKNDPAIYCQILDYFPSDDNLDDLVTKYKGSTVYYMYVALDLFDYSLRLRDNINLQVGSNEICIGHMTLPLDRLASIMDSLGCSERDISMFLRNDYYQREILSRELGMYSSWRNPQGLVYTLEIYSRYTNELVFEIPNYYMCIYKHYFDDVAAAYFLGMYEKLAPRYVAEISDDIDLDL